MTSFYPIAPELVDLHEPVLAEFKCQQSGNCCRTGGYVYVSDAEVAEMASHMKMTIPLFRETFVRVHNGWSVIASPAFRTNCFLCEDNRCQVYSARPTQCRTYPRWGSVWGTYQNFLDEVAMCPGLRLAYEKVTAKNQET